MQRIDFTVTCNNTMDHHWQMFVIPTCSYIFCELLGRWLQFSDLYYRPFSVSIPIIFCSRKRFFIVLPFLFPRQEQQSTLPICKDLAFDLISPPTLKHPPVLIAIQNQLPNLFTPRLIVDRWPVPPMRLISLFTCNILSNWETSFAYRLNTNTRLF